VLLVDRDAAGRDGEGHAPPGRRVRVDEPRRGAVGPELEPVAEGIRPRRACIECAAELVGSAADGQAADPLQLGEVVAMRRGETGGGNGCRQRGAPVGRVQHGALGRGALGVGMIGVRDDRGAAEVASGVFGGGEQS
jgi:hypothetical protein